MLLANKKNDGRQAACALSGNTSQRCPKSIFIFKDRPIAIKTAEHSILKMDNKTLHLLAETA